MVQVESLFTMVMLRLESSSCGVGPLLPEKGAGIGETGHSREKLRFCVMSIEDSSTPMVEYWTVDDNDM